MTGCRQLKDSSHIPHYLHIFVNLKSQMNRLIFIIPLYSWISPSLVLMMRRNILPPESVFSFLRLSISSPPPSYVCVCAPDSNDGAIYVWLRCGVCAGSVESEGLTTSCPPTVQPSTQRRCYYEVWDISHSTQCAETCSHALGC